MPLPTKALAENILTLLCHNDECGKIIASLVEPSLFESEYRIIAERAIVYWQLHGEAPKYHTADLVAELLEAKIAGRATTYARILNAMMILSDNVNTKYVMDQVRRFTRVQRLKTATLQAAERLTTLDDSAIEQVEQIWSEMLRSRQLDFDPGIRLANYEVLLEHLRSWSSEFTMGIPELDAERIAPARGAVLLFLAPTGKGKSWFLIHVGRRAMMDRKKVVHITLEMSEAQVMQRYYQSMFAAPKRSYDSVNVIQFDLDKDRQLEQINREEVVPPFALDSNMIREEIEPRVMALGTRVDNVVIKRFPTRGLTVEGLRAYLDNLEMVEHFIPDLCILDYIGVMKTNSRSARDHTISLGRMFEDLRGLMVERNIAGVTAHQTSKIAVQAGTTKLIHVAEDWSLIATSDVALAYSCTDLEAQMGLARLYVGKARDERDHFGLVLSQNYATGQFCIQSAKLTSVYDELRDKLLRAAGLLHKEDDEQEDEE